VCPPRPRAVLGDAAGISIIEVLAVTLVVGIAVVGVALMFGKGSAWVSAIGADRVAAGLAQQRIEQIRACGWDKATSTSNPLAQCPEAGIAGVQPLDVGLGAMIVDPPIQAANNHTFARTVCIQYVDPSTSAGLAAPQYAPPACPAGAVTSMIRVTVMVTSGQPEASPVTLQAWMSQIGP